MEERVYIAIDLKSFYASVECVDRGLDPMTTHLVVADESRTEKTICLAVSPALKAYGIPGRARLFEVVEKARAINRLRAGHGRALEGSSCNEGELRQNPALRLDYVVARPQMARYIQVSTLIYQIYLRYIAPEDIHVYSIDEVLIDATQYLRTYGLTGRELAMRMILDVLHATGITATAGIGSNLYLCKVAMDIEAKHIQPDANGVRIAQLDELTYRQTLWNHRPLTDFWRVGRGYASRLAAVGLYTMGDIARCSVGQSTDFYQAALLYKMFGINAELLIDHAWGWESCTMADIKAYRPEVSSSGSGQVLQCPYPFEKARLAAREMADALAMDLLARKQVTDQLVLTVGYDLADAKYRGPVVTDAYGRQIPKHAHGNCKLDPPTNSSREIMQAAAGLFDRLVNPRLMVRRIYVVAGRVMDEASLDRAPACQQLDFFTDYAALEKQRQALQAQRERERRLQEAGLAIRRKYGKNALLRGMNLQEGATAMERNRQIGGHKA